MQNSLQVCCYSWEVSYSLHGSAVKYTEQVFLCMAKKLPGKKCGNGLSEKHNQIIKNPGLLLRDFFWMIYYMSSDKPGDDQCCRSSKNGQRGYPSYNIRKPAVHMLAHYPFIICHQ